MDFAEGLGKEIDDTVKKIGLLEDILFASTEELLIDALVDAVERAKDDLHVLLHVIGTPRIDSNCDQCTPGR